MKKGCFFIMLALTLVLLVVMGQEGCEMPRSEPEPEIECHLSLCDCECHPAGQTREELEGVLCGINCYDLYNVSGCEYVNGSCEIVYRNMSQQENHNQSLENNLNSSSSQNNPEPKPSSGCGCGK